MARTGTLALTETSLQLILDLAGKGATNYIIAAAVGVHPDTFQNWLRKGKEEIANAPDSDDRELSIFEQLFYEIEMVRANLAADLSEVVIQTARSGQPNTWQAAMTFLERRYPADWGKRETRVHEGDRSGGLPQINILVLNDHNARESHRDLLRSVDRANRVGAGITVGPSVGSELTTGQQDGGDIIDVDSR